MRASLVLAASFALFTTAAHAGDLADANAAFDHKDYAKAFALYQPLAKAGMAEAQSAIGAMYFFGNGIAKNPSRAYMWFDLAARAPSPVATVAMTNREIVRRQIAASDISDAEAMATQCLNSHYEQCGLTKFAAR
jgi:TPR repeat protein